MHLPLRECFDHRRPNLNPREHKRAGRMKLVSYELGVTSFIRVSYAQVLVSSDTEPEVLIPEPYKGLGVCNANTLDRAGIPHAFYIRANYMTLKPEPLP